MLSHQCTLGQEGTESELMSSEASKVAARRSPSDSEWVDQVYSGSIQYKESSIKLIFGISIF